MHVWNDRRREGCQIKRRDSCVTTWQPMRLPHNGNGLKSWMAGLFRPGVPVRSYGWAKPEVGGFGRRGLDVAEMAENRPFLGDSHPVDGENSVVPGGVRHRTRAGTTWYECPYDIVPRAVRCRSWVRTTSCETPTTWLRGGTTSYEAPYDIVPAVKRHCAAGGTTLVGSSYDIDRQAVRHRFGAVATPIRGAYDMAPWAA